MTNLMKIVFFSLIAMVCSHGLDNLSKFKIEESSNLFPETDFNTYERPELETRSIIREDDDKLELVEIGKRRILYKRSNLNSTEIAKQFMAENYPNIEYIFKSILDFDDESDIASIHMAQAINGHEILNTAININIDKLSGGIISSGVSIWENIKPNSSSAVGEQTMDLKEAIVIANDNLELTEEGIDVDKLVIEKESNNYFTVSGVPFSHDGKLSARKLYTGVSPTIAEQIWELSAEIDIDYIVICVSINSRSVIQIHNITHHATYRVVPLNMPNIGNSARITYTDPYIPNYSPAGWHRDSRYNYQDTRGNNVHVIENSDGDDNLVNNVYISGGKDMKFEFNYSDSVQKIEGNQKAAAANVFYLANLLHDMYYKLGFTEGYGNFQYDNYSGKGKGKDPVYVIINDRNSKNNAQMSTNVDGKPAKLRLYPFNLIPGPERDPSFDNEIITHEYTHGVSQRLTGGPDTVECLKQDEAKGLNEGWSDFFANAFQFRKNRNRNTPLYLFRYVLDEEHGREYPISSDKKLNPLMYSDVSYNKSDGISVYTACEVWSIMLHEVFWNVVEKYRNNPDFFLKENQYLDYAPSNYIVMKIVIDGMKLQPCNPTFISARDSIFTALKNFNGNSTKLECLFWVGFAKRGLGVKAKGKSISDNKVIYTNDFTIPKECNQYKNF